jgi:hypothetical protein
MPSALVTSAVVAIVVSGAFAAAHDRVCSVAEAKRAEETADARTWTDLHAAFKRFSHCDDGAISEGYSDTVGRLVSHRWNNIAELR